MQFIDKINIAWTGDFECLKQFTNEFLKLHGDWSQPGGDKKVFACNYLTMTWRKTKQVLVIEGEKSDEVKRQICMEMLRDDSSLGQPLQTQENVTADKHTCMEEIECLKQEQSLNREMIQSLADAVSGLATALNGLQGNDRKNPRNSGFGIQKSDTEQLQYANQSTINDSIVPEKLSDSSTKDNNESLIVLEELPISNESERLCSEVKKKTVLSYGDHKTNYTGLSELIADEGHASGQQKLSYAEVLSMGDHDDLSQPATKASENVNFQKNSDVNLSKDPSDGFVGVKRKRKNYRQFFLSGISKDVSDSQIALYLAKQNVIASHISLFPSKRLGTISAKVGIPQAYVTKVQEQNFWPKFVCCKPWQHKDNMKPVVPGSINKRQGRSYATYV